MQELLSRKRKMKKEISPRGEVCVAMISNHKMRAVCSSLGHVSLYDGLLPVITSDFDKKIKEGEWMLTALTPLGIFSPFPIYGTQKGFRGRYEFEKKETEIRYTANFSGKGKYFSLTARFFLSPVDSLFITKCDISGDVTEADFSLSFSPSLVKTPRAAYCFFDCRDEKERFFFRERRARNGAGTPLYFGSCAHGVGTLPIRFGAARNGVCIRREGARHASFSMGIARDIDDLKALLSQEDGDIFVFSKWQSVLSVRDAVSEYHGCTVTEEMLLSRIMMGKKRFHRDSLYRLDIPVEGPLVLGEAYAADGKTLVLLREWVSLYLYMAIRGVPFTLLILCRYRDVREKIFSALCEMRGESLAFYAGGIFVRDASSFDARMLGEIRARADARMDISRGVWLS